MLVREGAGRRSCVGCGVPCHSSWLRRTSVVVPNRLLAFITLLLPNLCLCSLQPTTLDDGWTLHPPSLMYK